jgi:hypothetical protein
MRILSCAVVGVAVCLATGRAEADVGKAMAAAKDNLPADTQLLVVVDVAAIYKSPLFARVLEAVKREERDLEEVHGVITAACGWDPFSVVEGVVIAADPKNDGGIAFVQLSIDRAKATTCLEAVAVAVTKREGKGKVTVKQDGLYTVATKGTGRGDSVYFPWAGPNVVAVSFKPNRKEVVDAWFGKKAFAQSPVAALIGKLDAKAAVAGAFATGDGKALDPFVPVTKVYGNLMTGAGKLSGALVATTVDAQTSAKVAKEINDELQRDARKDRTPASVRKLVSAIKIAAAGTDITVSGSLTEKDAGAVLDDTILKKKKKESGSSSDMTAALAKLEEFARSMCACKDKKCAEKVAEGLTKWGTEMAKTADAHKPDAELAKQFGEVTTRYGECYSKLMAQ